LQPAGVDLSAFALIRSLYRPDAEQEGRVLYLNVDGLANLAIAEGSICRFTRVVGSGLEGMATELAERRGIALVDARARLAEADLTLQDQPVAESTDYEAPAPEFVYPEDELDAAPAVTAEEAEARELDMSYEELTATPEPPEPEPDAAAALEADVWTVLDNGIREISGEVRNSLDFHRSQDGGGEVTHVVLSGAAQDIPGFAEALQASLGVEIRPASVGVAEGGLNGGVSAHRLAVATGLAATEAPQ
jgi:type IV pilus assembly protein PilM